MDREALGVALGEVVALEDAVHGGAGGQLDDIVELHRPEPLAVEDDARPVGIQNPAVLLAVRLRVALDLLRRERRPRLRLARGIADQAGKIADDQHGFVAQVLELPQLLQHDGVADVEIGGRGVEPQLDAQRPPLGELRQEGLLGDDLHGPPPEALQLRGGTQRRHAAGDRISAWPPSGAAACSRGARTR